MLAKDNFSSPCLVLLSGVVLMLACSPPPPPSPVSWAQRLGWSADARVLILHADDVGMFPEANEATQNYLEGERIQSAALMVPCPAYADMAAWFAEHPEYDLGLHLTLNSEWQRYRWGPLSPPDSVPGLVDEEGYLPRTVEALAASATPEEVEIEIRAQIEEAIRVGPRPTHLDTHMLALYARPDFADVLLRLAEEYRIPANVVDLNPEKLAKARERGYAISDALVAVLEGYELPKLDAFQEVPRGDTYEHKREGFYELVRSLEPGISEIIFHPAVDSDDLRRNTDQWQQRVWEARLFDDPDVVAFLENEGVRFTDWKEIMRRFEAL